MTTSHETQNHEIAKRVVKASLFYAIALCLSIVPFSGAAAQTNGIAVIGPLPTSTPYSCTSGGINNAIADAINPGNGKGITAGIVDARNCTSMTGTAFTTEIDVGNSSSAPVTLYVPCSGMWTATMTGGTAYALKVFDKSTVIGCGAGEGQPFGITAGSGSNLQNVCGSNNALGYYRIEGFSCNAATSSTIGQAVCNFQYMQDESYVGHMTCTSETPTYRVTWINNNCCSSRFEGISTEGNGQPNMQTGLCEWASNASIHISAVSCVHPGNGKPAIFVGQNGGCNNHYNDVYMEQFPGQDTTTPYVNVALWSTTPCADTFDNFTASQDVGSSSMRNVFQLASGTHATIRNAQASNLSTHLIIDYNFTPAFQVTGPINTTFDYSTEATSIATATFANLGSVPAAGALKYCKDCARASICAGSGTGHMAVSNGTNWTCN